jgi:hypothetical protein
MPSRSRVEIGADVDQRRALIDRERCIRGFPSGDRSLSGFEQLPE